MAAGLQALPPDLGSRLGLGGVNLLQLLEAVTGVGYCHFCCSPDPYCGCMGASQSAPPMLWSQIVKQTPGHGVASSSGRMTTPSTFMGGMPGYMAPPPGLTPPDFSIWDMPPLEASLPRGLPISLRYLPPFGRAAQMRATLNRQALAPWAPLQWAPAPWTLPQLAPVQEAPQMVPPICQLPPFSGGQPVTLYQQAVQLPSISTGFGVTFDSSADKPAASGSQNAEGHGRQSTRGRDDNSRPASHSRGMQERSSIRKTSKQMPRQVGEHSSGAPRNAPRASTLESTPPQRGGGVRASPRDPLRNVAKYKSAGWRKDLEHVLKIYYRHTVTSFKEAEWAKMKEKFFTHLLQC